MNPAETLASTFLSECITNRGFSELPIEFHDEYCTFREYLISALENPSDPKCYGPLLTFVDGFPEFRAMLVEICALGYECKIHVPRAQHIPWRDHLSEIAVRLLRFCFSGSQLNAGPHRECPC